MSKTEQVSDLNQARTEADTNEEVKATFVRSSLSSSLISLFHAIYTSSKWDVVGWEAFKKSSNLLGCKK